MPNTRSLRQNRPILFSPSVVRQVVAGDMNSTSFQKVDYELLSSTALDHSGSFRYNTLGDGIKSTQQLNVDWSAFENHTFFNSAQVKTNVAFRKLYDQFPFDGTQSEFEVFLDSLTGFEKYVYDQFPKSTTYLFLSGTTPSEAGLDGTYVTVKDVAGVAYPGISKVLTGQSILNPGLRDMTIEFQLYVPAQANSASYILHKLNTSPVSGTHGFGITLEATGSTVLGKIGMGCLSGTFGVTTDIVVPKGQWNHVAFVWNRQPNINKLFGYVNGIFSNSSSTGIEVGLMNMDSADLIIGSGSAIPSFTGSNTLSGAIDELRIWHVNRLQQERDEYMQKNVFAQPNLKLYMRFNEPSGSQSPLVIDHSGNSLHGTLSTWAFAKNIRNIATSSVAGTSPMLYERPNNNPILFPLHPELEALNASLLSQAEAFDQVNPNRIDRLIPKHYLLQGQDQDGLTSEEGPIVEALAGGATPDTAKLGDTQVILMLLYIWAKFFDEIKLYIQAFGDLLHLDYDSTDTIPDAFLQFLASKFGITLPPLFTGASIAQFINAENLDNQISTNDYSLQYIQNQIWRRVLLNLQDVLRSKGTIHSVKTFIRSVGIEPDNNFRIREFGGPSFRFLSNARETRSESSTLINFSGSARLQSPFLSGSRLETESGFPAPVGPFVNGISSNQNDGLLTSGSWTIEGIYRFPSTGSLTNLTQSLIRIQTTGSAAPGSGSFLVANLIANPNGILQLVASPNANNLGVVTLSLTANIFDGEPWWICFGRQRADELNSVVSSSYFLRAAKQNFGEITVFQTASVFYDETVGGTNYIVWSNRTGPISTGNASGSYLVVGAETINTGVAFLNSASYDSYYRTSNFDGRAGHFRFWSRTLSTNEWREHVKNFKSLGVENPLANFNFVANQTGSFGRLRMDVSSDQVELTSSNTGFLQLTDFSQNNFHWSGSFPITSSVIVPQLFQYSLLSPKFDTGTTTDKVRVRSFQSHENALSSSYAQIAPVYALNASEEPQDNTRFTIDFSIVDALDQDIINIFSTLESLDNVIGNPELIFSPDYPDLDNLRNIYFNRLVDQINLKNFFEFYKWFDTNIGRFIAQLLPRKTKFLGTNFVIESHMLERPKIEYLFSDIYLGDSTRHALKDTILFQQFATFFNRF